MAIQHRLTSRLATTLLVLSTLAPGACGGPAFTNDDASGTGGEGGNTGGTASASGGNTNGTGGELAADGGAEAQGGSSGAPATSGGSNSKGGASTAGAASGGRSGGSSGGARSGGAGGAPSEGGTGGLGLGGLGLGGLGVGGLLGSGGQSAGFPRTQVLDDFSRDRGGLGSSWLGATDELTIRDEQLLDVTEAGVPLLWEETFGASQEVFATLVSFDPEAREINLVMRAQVPGNPCELIEIMYMPNRAQVGVAYCVDGDWTDLPPFSVKLAPGDQLGARINANGRISVFRNGAALTTFDASAFPYKTEGRIGVNALSSADAPATWDDFGGGNATP